MIISRTPFRLSFLGGGTDLSSFYSNEKGMVLSTTIDKYMYLTINDRFDTTYRLCYSKTEICNTPNDIRHPILRAVLSRYAPPNRGLEILSMADIPAGTGLGSSSSFTVGLLHALKAHLGSFQSAAQLAQEACSIEIDELKEPIGKQDQYAAAHGGLSVIHFFPDGEVSVEPVICSQKVKQNLETHVMMFYTGTTRSASKILAAQKAGTRDKMFTLRRMSKMVLEMKAILEEAADLAGIGALLHESWQLKQSLAQGISNPEINRCYDLGRKAGAWGGKVLGAGGGGFLMFLVPPERQAAVARALPEWNQIPVSFERWGSKIIFVT